MRLTKQTDYSLRVLIYLGALDGGSATIDQVAEAYTISRNHLMKVVHNLATKGILETQRGRKGGFRLARAPRELRLGEIIRLTEPDFAIAECLGESNKTPCPIDGSCRLKGLLSKATEEWLKTLNRHTLADLIEPRNRLVELLGANYARTSPIHAD